MAAVAFQPIVAADDAWWVAIGSVAAVIALWFTARHFYFETRGRPTARLDPSHTPRRRREYRFQVRNFGKVGMTDLRPWLKDKRANVVSLEGRPIGADNKPVDFGDPPPALFITIAPGETADFVIAVQEDALDKNPLYLYFTWVDTPDPWLVRRILKREPSAQRKKKSNVRVPET